MNQAEEPQGLPQAARALHAPTTLYLSRERSSQQDSSCNDQEEDKARLGLGHLHSGLKKQLVKVVDPPLSADLATGLCSVCQE